MATLLLLLKVATVFGLLAAVLWVLKRTDGFGGRAKGTLFEVRGSTRLGKGAALTLVRVDGKDLLLGVTDHTVTLLTSEQVDDEPTAAPSASFSLPSLTALTPKARRSTSVEDDAVAAALATLRGETPRPTPVTTDGSAATSTRLAARQRVARMDAPRDEEHLWTRACRPAFRSADGDDALA
jgi:flagellar protein FliO/FliZ